VGQQYDISKVTTQLSGISHGGNSLINLANSWYLSCRLSHFWL